MNLNDLDNEHIWAQKYRPKTIEDCILPVKLKDTMKQYLDKGKIPSFLFHGTGGIGKTTLALALCHEMNFDVMFINASLESGIDTLRDKIKSFASKSSLNGTFKVVILDEVEYSNAQSFQPALRGLMEEFTNNCSFILTCNYKNRLLPQVVGRCTQVDFKISSDEKSALAKQFFVRLTQILDKENIKYDGKVIAKLVSKYFPDFRQTLIVLQDYSISGEIDSGILINVNDDIFKDLFKSLKSKNFTEVRKWVGINIDIESNMLFSHLWKHASELLQESSIPQLVLILADYQFKAIGTPDPEINTTACLTEIMHSCKFKD